MKMDFHSHTIKTNKDVKYSKRNLYDNEYNDYINSRIENNVGVIAITNHNTFDLEQYKKLQELAGEKIMFIPGIELDVCNEDTNKKYAIVILCNPSHVDSFKIFVSKIENEINNKNNDKFISLQDLFNKDYFNGLDLIFSSPLGKSDSKKKFDENEYNYINEFCIKKNFMHLVEVSNIKSDSTEIY